MPCPCEYAKKTTVTPEKTRTEIERLLKNFGATRFAYGTSDDGFFIAFEAENRKVQFLVNMPSEFDRQFTHEGTKVRTAQKRKNLYNQYLAQRWRVLFLVIKAKIQSVACNVENFEEAFLPSIVVPGGTVSQVLLPQIDTAYRTGKPIALLPHFGEEKEA